jgi:hypothetical protein
MVRYSVGYWSRAFVTFGTPIPISSFDPHSRRDALELAQRSREEIGRLYKVLPTALLAASLRPSITSKDLESRVDALLDHLRAVRANLGVTTAREAVEEGAPQLEARGVILLENGRFRIRDRSVVRYYARTIEHLLSHPKGLTH